MPHAKLATSAALSLTLLAALAFWPQAAPATEGPVATFSIVAFDPQTGELGVAVQSKFIAVGAVVPFAKAEIGAIATQARANTSFGPKGMHLLAKGKSPQEAIDALTAKDVLKEVRQVGMVNAKGQAATFTGGHCFPWAGGQTGENYCVQGNILASKKVVQAMAKAFEGGQGALAERLLAALEAGQKAGGDRRGRQSAALLVVRKEWGYGRLRFDETQTRRKPSRARETMTFV